MSVCFSSVDNGDEKSEAISGTRNLITHPMQRLLCWMKRCTSARMYRLLSTFPLGMHVYTHSWRKRTYTASFKWKLNHFFFVQSGWKCIEQVPSGNAASSSCVTDYRCLTGMISQGVLSLFTHIDLLVRIVQMNVWGENWKQLSLTQHGVWFLSQVKQMLCSFYP